MITTTRQVQVAFGLNLRRLRSDRHWSQEYLAHRCHIHPTAVGRYERATRQISLAGAVQIAQALDVDLAELIA